MALKMASKVVCSKHSISRQEIPSKFGKVFGDVGHRVVDDLR